jgi:Predicted transcriptional regulator
MNTTYDIAHVLGNNVRILRNHKKISQLELALRTGRTQAFINKLENGKKWASAETLALLCRELDVPPSMLFLTDDANDKESGYAVRQSKEKMILEMRELLSRYEKEEKP